VTAIYLYCIVGSSRKPSAARVPSGLPEGSPPEVLQVGRSLWLIVAEVPLEIYGTAALDQRLSDLEWVGSVALEHEKVVEHFALRPSLTVVPMKLFTMFSTRERALADVAARQKSIDAVVRRISGAHEWGLRVTQQTAPRLAGSSPAAASSGKAFLTARKEARDAARNAKIAAAECATAAYRRLAKLAREARVRNDTPASAATPPLLDAAFLVPASRRSKFTQAARREAAACAQVGAQVTLSGPWPAYNFVDGSQTR
jgi:hypothetical protein